MNRPMVLAGSALAAVGVVLFLFVMIAGTGQPAPTDYLPQLQEPAETEPPSLLLSIVAGVILAAGAALIGIGMNRWTQVR
jgi:hypothetical protein